MILLPSSSSSPPVIGTDKSITNTEIHWVRYKLWPVLYSSCFNKHINPSAFRYRIWYVTKIDNKGKILKKMTNGFHNKLCGKSSACVFVARWLNNGVFIVIDENYCIEIHHSWANDENWHTHTHTQREETKKCDTLVHKQTYSHTHRHTHVYTLAWEHGNGISMLLKKFNIYFVFGNCLSIL